MCGSAYLNAGFCRKGIHESSGEANHQSQSYSSQHGGSAARSLPPFPLVRPSHDCAAPPSLRLRSKMVFVGLQACLLLPRLHRDLRNIEAAKSKSRACYPFGTRLMGFSSYSYKEPLLSSRNPELEKYFLPHFKFTSNAGLTFLFYLAYPICCRCFLPAGPVFSLSHHAKR